MQPDHRLRIGSESIPPTISAIGLLLEDGRIKLGEEIQACVPESPRRNYPVSVRSLMSHLAGLRRDHRESELEVGNDRHPRSADSSLGHQYEVLAVVSSTTHTATFAVAAKVAAQFAI